MGQIFSVLLLCYWDNFGSLPRASARKAGGVDIGHLSPLPYTQEAVEVICRNIAEVRRWVDVPLILENITYMVTLPGAEMTEAQFLAEVVEHSDCGLLLDITLLAA
ncbi:MAG: DUF692 family multinuclear iron-containing protein [Nostoc sp.]|uniref:multinuclear nonheme iron-dependent oxidase n=1 Tax=Nostoc sp. TaxID=1180 RepID=UPI002FF96821